MLEAGAQEYEARGHVGKAEFWCGEKRGCGEQQLWCGNQDYFMRRIRAIWCKDQGSLVRGSVFLGVRIKVLWFGYHVFWYENIQQNTYFNIFFIDFIAYIVFFKCL